MPFGSFVNALPTGVFVAIHSALVLAAAYMAYRSYSVGLSGFGWAFTLFALAELCYLSYHLDLTVILFAHLVAEVLAAVAFITLFVNGMRLLGAPTRSRPGGG